MKYLISLLFMLSSSFAMAAAAIDRPNSVSFELLGRAGLYSINYDRLLTEEFGVGAGFSSWSVTTKDSSNQTTGNVNLTVIPLYANWYLLGDSKHRGYATAGLDFVSGTVDTSSVKASGSGALLTAGFGYQYTSDGGFLFRATPYILAGNTTRLWVGATFGYSF